MVTKYVIMLILFIGILCLAISITKNVQQCPQQKIIYRYIPKTFEQEQNEPIYPSEIFKAMFTEESPWIRSINEMDYGKQAEINKYFISQI